ncbi:MAG: DNRLRE domain-containing protein [Deltaproteobacteria bacterium]|nr:DNRLRE domain-containing protein [Deltaproteobacteria bacterium]
MRDDETAIFRLFTLGGNGRVAALPSLLAVLLHAPHAGAAEYVNDPLTTPPAGTRGGTFSAGGWTTTAVDDTLWWTIPDALVSGSVEFTIAGASLATTLTGEDHDLVTLYQAPDGVTEPITYSPYFRNNDMRVFLRVFGSAGGTVQGATKVEGTQCMVGPPYYDNVCPAGCVAYDGIAYAHGNQNDLGWDAAQDYRFVIAWSGTGMTWSRNGELMGTLDFPSVFAPQPLVVHMGSPRNGSSTGQMPIGITYKDLLITGTAGSQTPVCNLPPPPPDAGPPVVDPCTDGSVGAIGDVTAAEFTSGVFSDPSDLNVEGDGAGNAIMVVYVMFPPQPASVSRALFRVHTHLAASSQGGSGQVCLAASSAWDENALTWANRPAVTTTCTGNARTVQPDSEVEWDVTSLMGGSGNLSFAIVSVDSDGAHYFSREAGGCARGPRLLVTPGAPPDAGTPVDAAVPADAAVPVDAAHPVDAAQPIDAAVRADAGRPLADAGASPHDAGAGGVADVQCSCDVSGEGTPAGLALVVLLALHLRRRLLRTARDDAATRGCGRVPAGPAPRDR